MTELEHVHGWHEAQCFGDPARICACGYWEEITLKHFRDLFGRAFWRFKKEYDDTHVFGGYKGRKRD